MNWRFFLQLSLLSVLAVGVAPGLVSATKDPATKAPATKASATKAPASVTQPRSPVVAQSAVAEETASSLPWLIGGGAAVAAIGGGAVALYRMGRQSGQQAATLDRAASEYRTLGDLAPAIPSVLEEELYGLKSAQPQLATQASAQEIAADQAEFVSDLHEFEAAHVDAAQLDAAFADVGDFEPLTAAQPVFPAPIAQVQPAIIAPTLPSADREPDAVNASAIVVGATDHAVRAKSIDGELIAVMPTTVVDRPTGIGLSRQTRLPKVGAVENLLKEIQNADPVKRRKAIWDLGQWGDTRAVQPLVDLMLDADSKQRSLILSALSEIGTRTIKPMSKALAISLQDDNADVRKNAIRDLTRIYDLVAQVSQMVQKCSVDDPDDEVRETATWALKQLNRIRPVSLDGVAALSAAVSPPENL
jgi:HEAT repeats